MPQTLSKEIRCNWIANLQVYRAWLGEHCLWIDDPSYVTCLEQAKHFLAHKDNPLASFHLNRKLWCPIVNGTLNTTIGFQSYKQACRYAQSAASTDANKPTEPTEKDKHNLNIPWEFSVLMNGTTQIRDCEGFSVLWRNPQPSKPSYITTNRDQIQLITIAVNVFPDVLRACYAQDNNEALNTLAEIKKQIGDIVARPESAPQTAPATITQGTTTNA